MPLASRPLGADLARFVGTMVRGDLVIEALLGVGAMASVFRAREHGVERDVAVKIMHPDLVQNPMLLARFRREARAAARIRHPNVVEVIGSGALEAASPGAATLPYLVFEYLDGLTLRSALAASRGTLPLARALHIVLQMSDAVGEAHELSIVHRDLKPENAMLVRRGDDPDFVKVLDFGLSRLGEGDAGLETHAGAVLGTARYVSPEGARGEAAGPAADVYALATILFECLAGRPPFDDERPVAVLVKKSSERAPDVRSFERARDVPGPIAALIATGLAQTPAERPPNGRAFGLALSRAAAQSGLGSEELGPRPTLLGGRSGSDLRASALTRVLGSPAPSDVDTTTSAPPATHAPPATPSDEPKPAVRGASSRSSPLKRLAVVTLCFAFGALGALGIATHLGACDRPWP
jgi:serine/threonine-protein kinase